MHAFQLEMCVFNLEMHETADFHSNLFVSWELVTEGHQGRSVECGYFEVTLPGMVILLLILQPSYSVQLDTCDRHKE